MKGQFLKNCEIRGWWFRKKADAGTTITHTMMNGSGVLNVPIQQRKQFYDVCIESLKNREKLYLVEQTKSGERFRMFLDIDYVTEEPVTDESIKRWVGHLYRTFPSLGNILISTCCRKREDGFKNGIHLSWPRTTVTSVSAMTVYERLKLALQSYDNEIPWDKILDVSVFKTGLRTILSHKWIRETREDVEPYVPRFEIGRDTRDFSEEKYTADMLEHFSILPQGNETEHFGDREKIISEGNVDNDLLVAWINEIYPEHGITRFDKIIPQKEHWVLSTSSKYCAFMGTEHKQNHGYFVVDKKLKTVTAKCHDDDHKGLKGRKYMVKPQILKYLQNLENKL